MFSLDSFSEEVHLWAEAVGVEVHRESSCHLWVQVCTLGLQLDQETGRIRKPPSREARQEGVMTTR